MSAVDADVPVLEVEATRELEAVTGHLRSLVDATVRTAAAPSALNEAAAHLARADALLRGELRDGPPIPDPAARGGGGMVFRHNPVVGRANPIAPPIAFEVRDGEVHARVTLGHAYEGPPGYVHGGILSLLLDQSLGYANVVAGRGGMTRSLAVTYRRPTPLETELEIWSAFDRVDGRDVVSHGTVAVDGVVTVEAEGIFRVLSRDQGTRYFGTRATG